MGGEPFQQLTEIVISCIVKAYIADEKLLLIEANWWVGLALLVGWPQVT